MKIINRIKNRISSLSLDQNIVNELRNIKTFENYSRSGLYFFLKRHILISSTHKFIYIKTPKNACTKILEVLYKGLTSNDFVDDYENIHKLWYTSIEKNIKPKANFYNSIYDDDYFKFSFVRNPYTRILSAWKNKIVDTKPAKVKIYREKLGLSNEKVTFKEFVEILKHNKTNNIHTDIHFTNQYDTLLYNIIQYDFIGKFENLQHDLSHIITQTNLPSYLISTLNEKVNNTSNHDLAKYYSPQIQSDVYDLYKIDFETFGYSKDLPL